MIRSMTGFGRCETEADGRKITVEMKAVNHRYLDINLKMPKRFNYFESAIRDIMKENMSRGKVDVFITCEDSAQNRVSLKYNEELAAEYVKYLNDMKERFELEDDLRASSLARFPEVLTMEEQEEDKESIWQLLGTAVEGACVCMDETRLREGENLKDDIIGKLQGMRELVEQIEERSPQIINAYRERLEGKVKELLADTKLEESRIAAEVVIYADKICTDEEMVRLKSHMEQMEKTLKDGGSVGRKLDFIAQELNREANTTLSKANDIAVSGYAIDLKTEIEKIREQIQNIE